MADFTMNRRTCWAARTSHVDSRAGSYAGMLPRADDCYAMAKAKLKRLSTVGLGTDAVSNLVHVRAAARREGIAVGINDADRWRPRSARPEGLEARNPARAILRAANVSIHNGLSHLERFQYVFNGSR